MSGGLRSVRQPFQEAGRWRRERLFGEPKASDGCASRDELDFLAEGMTDDREYALLRGQHRDSSKDCR